MKETKRYTNSNGVTTIISYTYYGNQRRIFFEYESDEARNFMNARMVKRDGTKAKKFYAVKSHEMVKRIMSDEWRKIMIYSDNWEDSPRYTKFSRIKSRIENNFN